MNVYSYQLSSLLNKPVAYRLTLIITIFSILFPCVVIYPKNENLTNDSLLFLQNAYKVLRNESLLYTRYRDYNDLNNKFIEMPTHELFLKADSIYKNDNSNQTAIMLFRIITSRYSPDITNQEKLDCATAWTLLGWHYLFDRKNPTQAYPFFRQALEIAHEYDTDGMLTCSVYTNLGEIYISFNDVTNALENYKKAFSTAIKLGNDKAIEYSYVDLIHFAWLSGNFDNIADENKFMTSRHKIWSKIGKYSDVMTRAYIAESQNNHNLSEKLLNKALSMMPSVQGDHRYVIENRLIAADICLSSGNYDGMLNNLHYADSLITLFDESLLLHLLHDKWKNYYLAIGDSTKAKLCESRNLQLRDSLFNLQKYGVIRDIETSYQAQKFEYDLLYSHSQTRRHIEINIILGSCIIIICLLLFWIIRKNNSLRQKNNSLFHKNIELIETYKKLNSSETIDKKQSLISKECIGDNSHPEIEDSLDDDTVPSSPTVNHDKQTDKMKNIFSKIKLSIADSNEIFNPDFNIETLSNMTGIKSKTISQAINSLTGKNFSTFVAEYRINKACEMLLANSGSMRPTIEIVAEEVGYRSRTHFSRVFKSVTGLTTTEFLHQAKQNMPNPQP